MIKSKTSKQFDKDYERLKKQRKDIDKLNTLMIKIINEELIELKYKKHPLKGKYKDFIDCHIEGDWLLIYRIDDKERCVIFERTGTHSEIFGK